MPQGYLPDYADAVATSTLVKEGYKKLLQPALCSLTYSLCQPDPTSLLYNQVCLPAARLIMKQQRKLTETAP